MKKPRAIFISSTGGHFVELMTLEPMFENFDYYLINDGTKASKSLKEKYGKRVKFLIQGNRDRKVLYVFQMAINTIKSLYLFFKIRPKVIISTGAHTCMPMYIIGRFFRKLFKTKLVFIETYANSTTKTGCGKYIYNFADLFIVQWESMLELYPDAKYFGGVF